MHAHFVAATGLNVLMRASPTSGRGLPQKHDAAGKVQVASRRGGV
jgi:hypothetical protein